MDSLAADALTETKLAAIADHASLGVHRIPMPRVLGAGDLTAPLRIRRLAKHLGIDVVHGHGAKGGFYGRLARIGCKTRVAIYTPHGGVLHYSRNSPSGRLFLGLEALLMAYTDAVIFESAYAQSTYAEVIGHPDCRQVIVHNGLAATEFEPVPSVPDAHDFAFVGELREIKGIDVLLDALSDLRRPDGHPATLIMAGDGPSREALEEQIARLGLGERVELAGVRPAREVFARGRCVVVPSRAESLPYIVLEAVGAQKPLIATAVGGVAEIFGPTSDALVAPGDADALERSMTAFLDDPGAADRAMRERFTFVAERFTLDRMVSQIEETYFQALEDR